MIDKQRTFERIGTDLRSEALEFVSTFYVHLGVYLSTEMSLDESLQKARNTRKASITETVWSSISFSSSTLSASVPRKSSALTLFLNESL